MSGTTNTIIAAFYFIFSIANDYLSVYWHRARERGQPVRCANIAFLLGAIGWLPYVLFVTHNNWQIIVADALGNWLGSYLAVRGTKDSPLGPKVSE